MNTRRGRSILKPIAKLIIAMFLTALMSPLQTRAASYGEFQWLSPTVIGNLGAPAEDHFVLSEETLADTSRADYLFVRSYTDPSDASGKTIRTITMSVSRSDPTKGSIGGGYTAPTEIAISDPNHFAPEPAKLITKGMIWGKLLIDPNISISNQRNLVDQPITLFSESGTPILTRKPTPIDPNNLNWNWKYNAFSFSEMPSVMGFLPGGGLYSGIYKLYYKYSKGVRCADNEYDAGIDPSQLVCSADMTGEVVFRLEYDTTLNDGSAIVTMIGNDPKEQTSPADGKNTSSITSPDLGINMSIGFNTHSPLDSALSGAIKTFADWTQTSLKWVMEQIDGLLQKTADYVVGPIGCKDENCGVLGAWTAMRNIGLTLLIMALIIIAFANALQIDIEQYGLNRMIPKIIISIVLAYASWVIVIFFFDFTNAIQKQAIGLLGGSGGLDVLGDITINTPGAGDIVGKIGAILLLLVILVGVLVCGVVLLFTLLMRIVMLSFLLAVAPLAFILNIVPFTSSLYKKWWDEFFKWMFMGPIALVIISLGSVIAASVSNKQFGSGAVLDASSSGAGEKMLIGLLIFGASMYMAAKLPMEWGGKIMQGWGKIGKNLWGKTGGAAGNILWKNSGGRLQNMGKTFFDTRNANKLSRDKAIVGRLQAGLANSGIPGSKWAASGVTGGLAEVAAKNQHIAAVRSAGEKLGVKDAGVANLEENVTNQSLGKYEREASLQELLDRGLADGGKAEVVAAFDEFGSGNTALINSAAKNNRDMLLRSSLTDSAGNAVRGAALSKLSGMELKEMGGGEIEALIDIAAEGDTGAQAILKNFNTAQATRVREQSGGKLVKKINEKIQKNPSAGTLFGQDFLESLNDYKAPKTAESNIPPQAQASPTQGPSSTEGYEQRPSGLWTPKDRS